MRVRIRYKTPALWGILNAAPWETKLMRNKWADWPHNPF